MNVRKTPLNPGCCYHIYNRGVNSQNIFFEPKNYHYFLERYAVYVHPFVNTLAYCLLGNHFHLLVRVKDEEELRKVITKNHERPLSWHVSNAFGSFFQSYTRGMNKVYGRTGPLLEESFKRKEVDNDTYLTRLIYYIHQNPQRHGMAEDFKDYPYSSYQAHLGQAPTKLDRATVISWFGNTNNYIVDHSGSVGLSEDWFLE
ncbi:MAG: hypothetical protein AAF944_19155 [Bacteroidota bacterium]